MKKGTIWLVVILVLVLAGGVGYLIWKNQASADVIAGEVQYSVAKNCPTQGVVTGWTKINSSYNAKVGDNFCFSVTWPSVSDFTTISKEVVGYQNEIAGKAFSYQIRGSGRTGYWYQVKAIQAGRGTFLFTYGNHASYFMIKVLDPTVSPTPTPVKTSATSPTIPPPMPTPTPVKTSTPKPSVTATPINGIYFQVYKDGQWVSADWVSSSNGYPVPVGSTVKLRVVFPDNVQSSQMKWSGYSTPSLLTATKAADIDHGFELNITGIKSGSDYVRVGWESQNWFSGRDFPVAVTQ